MHLVYACMHDVSVSFSIKLITYQKKKKKKILHMVETLLTVRHYIKPWFMMS